MVTDIVQPYAILHDIFRYQLAQGKMKQFLWARLYLERSTCITRRAQDALNGRKVDTHAREKCAQRRITDACRIHESPDRLAATVGGKVALTPGVAQGSELLGTDRSCLIQRDIGASGLQLSTTGTKELGSICNAVERHVLSKGPGGGRGRDEDQKCGWKHHCGFAGLRGC